MISAHNVKNLMPKPRPKKLDRKEMQALAKKIVQEVKFPMLSTIDGDHPRLRPVSPVLTRGFEVYIANLKSYHKTVEIEANNKVEICYLDPDHNQVRISAIAQILDDRQLLQEIWDKNALLKHYLGSIDNPELIVYKCVPAQVRFMQEWALNYHEIDLD